MADIQADVEALHNAAFDPLGLDIIMELADSGAHKFRSGNVEHLFNPQTIHLFQKACWTNDYGAFKPVSYTHLTHRLVLMDSPCPVSSPARTFRSPITAAWACMDALRT